MTRDDLAAEQPEVVRLAQAMALAVSVRPAARADSEEPHAEQVAELAARIASHLGLPSSSVLLCRIGGWLHDLGKGAIPDELLAKRGPLEPDEVALMRTHPIVGEQLVRQIGGLADAAPILRHHHERYDGFGYPDGLRGDAIPIEAAHVMSPDDGPEPVEGQGGEHGLVLAPVLLGRRVRPLTPRRPGVTRSEPAMAAGLVQPDPGRRIDEGGEFAPGASPHCVALARRQRLFFRVQPRRVSARLIVAVLTSTPACSTHQAHCSESVASACVLRRSGSAASRAFVLTATGPGTGFGATAPVSRFNRSHRSIVGSDTANRAATSSRGVPINTDRTTHSRRSSEYGFMPGACQNHQACCNPL